MDDSVSEIKRRLNIIDIIQEYTPLKKVGTNWRCRCPFHQEKTPSFMVSEDKQIWHCFGCGEGGDMFEFVKKMEGIEFAEALRILASKAHVTLQHVDPQSSSKKVRYFDILKKASEYYHQQLLTHPAAKSVRDYAKQRGLTLETVEDFQLGYALESWEGVRKFLLLQNFSDQEIFEVGLTIKSDKGRGFYDRFRDRFMFPIHDVHGNVIGFGGRILKNDKTSAKYINSPETPVYHKSNVLYNIHRAKQSIRTEKYALVMEGYMDVITAYQAGIKNVVAASGTALTQVHVRLLKRYCQKLYFSFDMDDAGKQAAKRAITPALAEGMAVHVVVSDGKDPDESIRKDKSAFMQALTDAPIFMDYYVRLQEKIFDLQTAEGKKQFVQDVLPVIAKLSDIVEQTHYVQQVAQRVQVDEKLLLQKLPSLRTVTTKQNIVAKKEAARSLPPQAKERRQILLLDRLLGLLFAFPKFIPDAIDRLKVEIIEDPFLNMLYKQLVIHYTKHINFDWKLYQQEVETDPHYDPKRFTALLIDGESNDEDSFQDSSEEIRHILDRIEKDSILKLIRKLQAQMRQAEQQKDLTQLKQLSEQFNRYSQKLQQF